MDDADFEALGFALDALDLDALDVLRQTLTRGRQVSGTHVLSRFVGFEISSKSSMNLENSEGFAYVR